MKEIHKQESLANRISKHYSDMMKSTKAKDSPLNYLETRLETLETYWKDCYSNHWVILSNPEFATTDYVTKSLFDGIEEDYTSTKALILREIQKLKSVPNNPPTPPAQGNNTNDNSSRHLPVLSLPKFSGNQLEWETFRDLFVAMVDKTKLSNVQKLYYLKSSLTGKAAERIKNLTVSDSNYNEAWSMLVKRYDNQRIILASHMRKLLSCPPASKRSVDEILRLLDATNESIRALSNMGRPVDLWDDWFVHLLVHKLDSQTREAWESSLKDSEEYPNFDDLSAFLEGTVRALEASHSPQSHTTSQPNSQPGRGKRSTISVNVAQSETSPGQNLCPLCQSSHFISYCPQFKKLKIPQRLEQVKRLKLCFNCLRNNHRLDDCPSKNRCYVCNIKHHTFLHEGTRPSTETTVKSTEPTPSSTKENVDCHTSYLTNHLSKPSDSHSKGIFATAYVKLTSYSGKSIIVKSFLDSGSERTLITEHVAQLLKLPKVKCEVSLKGINDSPLGSSNYKVGLWLQSPKDPNFQFPLQALVLKSLVQMKPKGKNKLSEWPHLKGLDLADPNYHRSEPVDCVIGIDAFGHILLPGLRKGSFNSPTALSTIFGWIIFGQSASNSSIDNSSSILHVVEKESLNNQLRLFWELEEIPKTTFLSEDELQCERHFQNTHYRNRQGQYVVQLPFQKPSSQLGRSKEPVVAMFKRNEAQLLKEPTAKAKYNAFMQEYLSLNHMQLVSQEDQNFPNPNYLPHHVITKPNDPLAKLRVVFNGSFQTSSGVSFNDILHPGQKLQTDIWLIISRWRFWKFAFTADIVKMFRQILIQSPDLNLQRIVWRAEPHEPLQEYNLSTVTYGTRSAPFLASRVLQQLAQDERSRFPLGAQVLQKNVYVDDMFPGANSLDRATEIRDDLIKILETAGIKLSKWAANHTALIPDSEPKTNTSGKIFDPDDSVSTLGLRWNQNSDQFHFTATFTVDSNPTKRSIASAIAKLYDPVGWLSPFLVRAKILLQDCWLAGSDWDKPIPNTLQVEWNSFQEQLQQLNSIRIPRWIQTTDDISNWELHGFSDASERAYSVALYLVDRSPGNVHSHLLISKTKLAPVKVVTLPKLELCAAHLLAKLAVAVLSELLPSINSVYYWSDSQIVLCWLQGHPSRWKPFVANRVSDIHTISKNVQWRHVSSKDNPADCSTRGFTVEELRNSHLWWHGPAWLANPLDQWPSYNNKIDPKITLEARAKFVNKIEDTHLNLAQEIEVPMLLNRVSSLMKLIRVTSYCRRFILKCRNPRAVFTSYLDTDEIKLSLLTWIRLIQNEHFPKIIRDLNAGKELPRNHPITKLSPFLDKDQILRIKGRLANSYLSYEEKHPAILPKDSRFSELIVSQAHRESLHGGQQLTLSRVLRQFWIVSAKTLINRIVRDCVKCTRFRTTSQTQLMGELPTERVTESKPFTYTGLDYAGPYHILPSKRRGIKSNKGYICLFVCFASRAIHLEVVSDYETKTFIAAFNRFISRRGQCKKIFSDNARNFVGAERELKKLFDKANTYFTEITEDLANRGIQWSFIPAHSPHFGGIWEAGVKSVKHHLRRVIGDTRLTFEELSTVLCQIEACLNSRPLYPNTSDPLSVSAITPGHILTGGPISAIPEPSLKDLTQNPTNRWKLLTKMRDEFWSTWSREYLHHLQQRNKWWTETNPVKVGDIVLIKDDNLPPTRWNLGRIQHLHPGRDNLTRVVTIKTATTSLKRSLSKLIILPINTADSDDLL